MNPLALTLAIFLAFVAVNVLAIRWFMVMTAIRNRADAQAAARVESITRAAGAAATPIQAEAA